MDLILWRHAQAEDLAPGGDDFARPLTARGQEQAGQIAAWLEPHLPEGTRILCSPALRCEQTVFALGRRYEIDPDLAPGSTVRQVLAAAQWPAAMQPVVIVGHQPILGEIIAHLLQFRQGECPVRKGAVWWLRTGRDDGQQQTTVVAVRSPGAL